MKKTVLGAMVVAMAALTSNAFATSGYDKKFFISSDDGAYTLSPGVLIDGMWTRVDADGEAGDMEYISLQRTRAWMRGSWGEEFSYDVTVESDMVPHVIDKQGTTANSTDVMTKFKYVNLTHNLGMVKLRFGLQKLTVGGDIQESAAAYQFVARPTANKVGSAIMAGGGDPAGGLALVGSAAGVNYTLGLWENNKMDGSVMTNGYDMSVDVSYTGLGKMTSGMSDLMGERAYTVGVGAYYNNTTPGVDNNYQTAWLKYKGGGYSFGLDYHMGTAAKKTSGLVLRVGKVFAENQEVAFRYDSYDSDKDAEGELTTMSLAYNYFFNGENAKVMAQYDMADDTAAKAKSNTMYVKYHISF